MSLFNKDNTNKYFITACMNGDMEIVRYIFEHNYLDLSNFSYTLEIACIHGRLESVMFLVNNCHDLDFTQAFNYACVKGYLDIVKFLFASDHNITDREMELSFESACRRGHTETVNYLIGQGIQYSTNTTVNIAINNRQMNVLIVLLENGAKCEYRQIKSLERSYHRMGSGILCKKAIYLMKQNCPEYDNVLTDIKENN